METLSSNSITISTTVNAPVDKVWNCFNTPAHITQWCFASEDWHAPAASSDFVIGGKSNIRMEAKDGSFGFDFGWTFDNIIPLKLVAYTMEDGRKAAVTFQETDAGVTVTEQFDPEQENPHDMQRAGWQSILDNFRKYVESH
ncbi:SRPBCC family protein [Flavihumibacter fluvii]|uniref:SRPBCC family protein n=1 Tax=Flavihumibacter fluvii TaxID=2838157 RepID=UPI001BDE2FB9|nr:SRPBCC family protein [Flavihumibacter fluvii]ULQ54133.1 SRPBCC family protein [Flavihumibacter fluvii]